MLRGVAAIVAILSDAMPARKQGKKYPNLSGRLDGGAKTTELAHIFTSSSSLIALPKWAHTLPLVAYPSIKLNRRPTAECKRMLQKHKDLLDRIKVNCHMHGTAFKVDKAIIRDALLKAFVEKPTLKHQMKAATIAARIYVMVTHARRLSGSTDRGGEEDEEEAGADDEDAGASDEVAGTMEHTGDAADAHDSGDDDGAEDAVALAPARAVHEYTFAAELGLVEHHGPGEPSSMEHMGINRRTVDDADHTDSEEVEDSDDAKVSGAATVFMEYDPVEQMAYAKRGDTRTAAIRLHQPDPDSLVIAEFAPNVLTTGTEWEVPSLTVLPRRWGGTQKEPPPQGRQRTKAILKRPARAIAAAVPSVHLEVDGHAYTIAQKADRGTLYTITLRKPEESKPRQVLQLTQPQLVAAGLPSTDQQGWAVMREVISQIRKLRRPITNKAALRRFKVSALNTCST